MKKILAIFLSIVATSVVHAAQTNFYVMNSVGSGSDIIARVLAEKYKSQTGNTLTVINVPGGDQIPAAVRFKQDPNPSVLLGGTSMHVYNYIVHENLPYSDQDFKHLGMAESRFVYIVPGDSQIQNTKDLVAYLKRSDALIGTHDSLTRINALVVADKINPKLKTVAYKGSTALTLAAMGGEIPVALTHPTPEIFNNQQAGKVRVIAYTGDADTTIYGVAVPSFTAATGIPQFAGGILFSITPGTSAEHTSLEKNLLKALQSAEFKNSSEKIQLIPVDMTPGQLTKALQKRRDILIEKKAILTAK